MNAVERLKGTRQSVKLLAAQAEPSRSHLIWACLPHALHSITVTLILTTLPLEPELAPDLLLLSRR